MSKLTIVSKFVFPILLLTLLLAVGAGLALAGRSDNAEGGLEIPLNNTLSSNDEEVAANDDEAFVARQAWQQTDDFPANGEGQPETESPNFVGEEVELQEESNAPLAQFFKNMAGSNFQPRDSTTTFSYGGGGCMQRNSNVGDSWFTIDIQLPEGAIIDFMRVYYYDNSGTYDINSELWAFDGVGGTMLIAEADSSGTPGYSSAGSDFFEHTVDNINESLVVVASIQGGVGADLMLCGVRIRYQYNPLSASFLPAVLNQAAP